MEINNSETLSTNWEEQLIKKRDLKSVEQKLEVANQKIQDYENGLKIGLNLNDDNLCNWKEEIDKLKKHPTEKSDKRKKITERKFTNSSSKHSRSQISVKTKQNSDNSQNNKESLAKIISIDLTTLKKILDQTVDNNQWVKKIENSKNHPQLAIVRQELITDHLEQKLNCLKITQNENSQLVKKINILKFGLVTCLISNLLTVSFFTV